MKSGILHIITIALLIVNLVVSGLIMIVAVPSMKNTNDLIKQVTSVINLDLKQKAETGDRVYKAEETEQIAIPSNAAGEDLMFTLPKADGTPGGMKTGAYVSLYKKGTDFSKIKTMLSFTEADGTTANPESKMAMVNAIIADEIQKFKQDELQANQTVIEERILEQLQQTFNAETVVEFRFTGFKFSS